MADAASTLAQPAATPPAATPPATGVSDNNAAAAAAVTPPAGEWYSDFKDPGLKDWLKSYGEAYPNPEAVAMKALNLEKFVGADKAGRGVITPKPDAPADEWAAFYKKIGGVPDNPDGYKLPDALKDDPMATKFRDRAHKMGLPPQFFDEVVGWFGEEVNGAQEAQFKQWEQQSEREMDALKTEWGPDHDKNVEMGRRAARQFIPHENDQQLTDQLTKLEGALGSADLMKLLANIGKGLGEHQFVGGEGTGGNGGITPEGARLRIQELKADREWGKAYANGDAEKKAEWDRLHKIAYPAQSA